MIKNLVGGLFGKVVENAEGILDKVITTDKERDEAKLALKGLLLEAEKEDLGEFEISFISTIFGAMSAKVNTVVDFFFGGSSKKNEQQQINNK